MSVADPGGTPPHDRGPGDPGPRHVWIIYADQDRSELERLRHHLEAVRDRVVAHDRGDYPLEGPAGFIESLSRERSQIVWLVTAASLSSGPHDEEIAAAGDRPIVPIIAGACLWGASESVARHREHLIPRDAKEGVDPRKERRTDDEFWSEMALAIAEQSRAAGWAKRHRFRLAVGISIVSAVMIFLRMSLLLFFKVSMPTREDALVIAVSHRLAADDRKQLCAEFQSVVRTRQLHCVNTVPCWQKVLWGGVTEAELLEEVARAHASGRRGAGDETEQETAGERSRGALVVVVEPGWSARLRMVSDSALASLLEGALVRLPATNEDRTAAARVLWELASVVSGDEVTPFDTPPVLDPARVDSTLVVLAEYVRDTRGLPLDIEEYQALERVVDECDADTRWHGATCCLAYALRGARKLGGGLSWDASVDARCEQVSDVLIAVSTARVRGLCRDVSASRRLEPLWSHDAVYRSARDVFDRWPKGLERQRDLLFIPIAACVESLDISPAVGHHPELVRLSALRVNAAMVKEIAGSCAAASADDVTGGGNATDVRLWAELTGASVAHRGQWRGLRGDWKWAMEDLEGALELTSFRCKDGPAPPDRMLLVEWAEAALQAGEAERVLSRLRPTEGWLPQVGTKASYLVWLAALRTRRDVEERGDGLLRAYDLLLRGSRGPNRPPAIEDVWGTLGRLTCTPDPAVAECKVYQALMRPADEEAREQLGAALREANRRP